MAYLPVALNHFRAVNEWASRWDASVTLNTRTFVLNVQVAGRYCLLRPRFFLMHSGKMAYTTQLVKDVNGFIGWLPYDVLVWDLSQNKLLAKTFFGKSNLRTPATWNDAKNITENYVQKSKAGSFGYEVKGPYRNVSEVNPIYSAASSDEIADTGFAEEFIEGTNLKVWFWDTKAIYAQHHAYPAITADGILTVENLIQVHLAKSGTIVVADEDQKNMGDALRFQQLDHADIPPPGLKIWLDFRYGRRYMPTTLEVDSDSDLNNLGPELTRQVDLLGRKVGEEAFRQFNKPILYSVDGVVDEHGQIWWLEINSNPMLPPEGYPHIFKSLFGLSEKSIT